MEIINGILIQIYPSLVALIALILVFAVTYLFNMIRKKVKVKIINDALGVVETTIKNIVISLKQMIVDELKEKSADGKLTKEEMLEIKQLAITKALGQIPLFIQELLGLGEEQLSDLIGDWIEAQVVEQKEIDMFGQVLVPKSLDQVELSESLDME